MKPKRDLITVPLDLTLKEHTELTNHKDDMGLNWPMFVLKLSRDARGIK